MNIPLIPPGWKSLRRLNQEDRVLGPGLFRDDLAKAYELRTKSKIYQGILDAVTLKSVPHISREVVGNLLVVLCVGCLPSMKFVGGVGELNFPYQPNSIHPNNWIGRA